MIQLYPASSRFAGDRGWLQSQFSFSFGDFYDEANTSFGPLRVFNNDIVQGGYGFGAHPHREMEIVTVVLSGKLKHEDNTGQSAVTSWGGVQRMSAGTGIIHSEVNPGTEPCELLQMWFTPNESQLPPSYETTTFDPERLKGRLLPIVSRTLSGLHTAYIHQDLTMYLSELESGQSLTFKQTPGRRIYLFVIEGSIQLTNEQKTLNRRDAARMTDTTELHIHATHQLSRLLLIDLP